MNVFDALNVVYLVLMVIVAIGFLRLILPKDGSQVLGTLAIIALIVAVVVLIGSLPE